MSLLPPNLSLNDYMALDPQQQLFVSQAITNTIMLAGAPTYTTANANTVPIQPDWNTIKDFLTPKYPKVTRMTIPKNVTSPNHPFRYDKLYLTEYGTIVRLKSEHLANTIVEKRYKYNAVTQSYDWVPTPTNNPDQLVWTPEKDLSRFTKRSWRNTTTDFTGKPYIDREATPKDVVRSTLSKLQGEYEDLHRVEIQRPQKEKARHALAETYKQVIEEIENALSI